jgi:uncharacterized protein (TIGR02452 family)
MNKQERAELYTDTVKLVQKGVYTSPNGNEVHIDGLDDYMIQGTKFYGKKVVLKYDTLPRYETEIKVINNDCLYEAKNMIENGLKPAVLNMASFHTPGGGVINGSAAQEENLFRRTNLFKSLYQFHHVGDMYGIEQKDERYPLEMNYGGIYTPKVIVFRGSDDVDYQLMEEPFYVDIITLPAIKNPKVEDGKIVPWAETVIKNKIKQIFNIALENGNDSLVLSAFGCGAYGTPPEQMAKFFADVLASERYQGLFKVIHFAILNVPSTNGEHNPHGNFQPFKDVFG